jgi:GMP synthase (glutamine-hydrolysing)
MAGDGCQSDRASPRGRVLIVRHVPWERSHRLGQVLAQRFELIERCPIEGHELPPVEAVDAAVFMGGPMGADEDREFPALAAEREWIREAVERHLPTLGICLGAQLLARALGGQVHRGERPEICWAPIVVHEPKDPLLGPLAAETVVLHWHSDVFDLPEGALSLASSEQTRHQAFRFGRSWGLLFHPEADRELVASWLAEPAMVREVPPDTDWEHDPAELVERSTRAFNAFAELIDAHRRGEVAPARPRPRRSY